MNSLLAPYSFHVVIPCHNCEAYIGECLASLQRQSFENWTALVADDCSTDNTADVVRSFMQGDDRIRLRVGGERAWLMGNTLDALRSLDLYPADVVAILDGDDWIMPTCLENIWKQHLQGYDLVYTDEEIQGLDYSIGSAPIPGVSIRKQGWRFSQLRSFKSYLFSLLPDETFRDANGQYFRAAGDLSLYFPMAELAGPKKLYFIPEKLYFYRVHEHCNFKVLRQEQLDNNWDIRSRPALEQQTDFFDFVEAIEGLEKSAISALASEVRKRHSQPYTVRVDHTITPDQIDSWRAYHELWIEEGVFFTKKIKV